MCLMNVSSVRDYGEACYQYFNLFILPFILESIFYRIKSGWVTIKLNIVSKYIGVKLS